MEEGAAKRCEECSASLESFSRIMQGNVWGDSGSKITAMKVSTVYPQSVHPLCQWRMIGSESVKTVPPLSGLSQESEPSCLRTMMS